MGIESTAYLVCLLLQDIKDILRQTQCEAFVRSRCGLRAWHIHTSCTSSLAEMIIFDIKKRQAYTQAFVDGIYTIFTALRHKQSMEMSKKVIACNNCVIGFQSRQTLDLSFCNNVIAVIGTFFEIMFSRARAYRAYYTPRFDYTG